MQDRHRYISKDNITLKSRNDTQLVGTAKINKVNKHHKQKAPRLMLNLKGGKRVYVHSH